MSDDTPQQNWRFTPMSEWTDAQIDEREREYRDELRREWCGTLIMQALGDIQRERTSPKRLAERIAAAEASLIGIRVIPEGR